MPRARNTPGKARPWAEPLVAELARRYRLPPAAFPPAWRSDRGVRVTLEDVVWLIVQIESTREAATASAG